MLVPTCSTQWEPFRPVITELYATKNRKLKDVQYYMERNHNFRASKHMYIDKFKAWGINKQYKVADAQKLAAKIAEAVLKDTPVDEIMFRGRPVNSRKVLRHMTKSGKSNKDSKRGRHRATIDTYDQASSAAVLPATSSSPMSQVTPEQCPRDDRQLTVYESSFAVGDNDRASLVSPLRQHISRSPTDIEHLGDILSHLQAFVGSTPPALFTIKVLNHCTPTAQDPVVHDMTRAFPGLNFFDTIKIAVYFMRLKVVHLAWPLLHTACEELSSSAFAPDPFFLTDILMVLSPATHRHHPLVRRLLLRFVASFCSQRLGGTHPLTEICCLLEASSSASSELALRALKFMLNASYTNYKDSPELTARIHRTLVTLVGRESDLDSAEQLAVRGLKYTRGKFGDCQLVTEQAMMELVYVYTYRGEYDKGLELCAEALHSKKVRLGYEYPDSCASHAMENMAELHYLKGNINETVEWLNKALFSAWSIRGAVGSTILVRDNLEKILISNGRHEEAKKVMLRYSIVDDSEVLLPV